MDILIFAIIAGVLIARLKSVLGTRTGEERVRPNPFAPNAAADAAAAPTAIIAKPLPLPKPAELIDAAANQDGRIDRGLDDIAAADPGFDVATFMAGGRAAFDMVVGAFARGDRTTLQNLLSPKLYADFNAVITAREAGHAETPAIPQIQDARINEAHLGGTMAYITVDYLVDGGVHDIWTFTRDMRTHDPNWTLIETRAEH